MSKEREDISPAVWALVQAINAEIHDGDGAAYDADIEEAERINAAIEGAGFVVLPREPTTEMIEATRSAELAPGKADGYPIWDNMSAPSTGDREDWENVLPGITQGKFFHASYEWPTWQEHLFRTAYRAMINAYSPKPSGVEAPPPTQSEEP